ncbi:MAG: hypothetical protein HOC72_14510, partial [Rhodospirillaceae bacterium]|nr:hypothetical protein [Rhodospirillaceae bacterium]
MKNYNYIRLPALVFLLTILLMIAWEFLLEAPLMALLGSGDIETDQQRWRYVMTAAVVSILALALPVWRLRASEIERNRMDIELKNIQTDLEKVLADRTKELQVSNELRQATDYRFQDF